MQKEFTTLLQELERLLIKGGCSDLANRISSALLEGEESTWEFICSNGMWGGAGSIADQAIFEKASDKMAIYQVMQKIGHLQIASGRINERTELWVEIFGGFEHGAASNK